MEAASVLVTTVYTFAMAKTKVVYIQLRTVEKTVIIAADQVEESGTIGYSAYTLTIKRDGAPVGKFDGGTVAGWWIGEPDLSK